MTGFMKKRKGKYIAYDANGKVLIISRSLTVCKEVLASIMNSEREHLNEPEKEKYYARIREEISDT